MNLLHPFRGFQIRQLRQLFRIVFSSIIGSEGSVKEELFLLDPFTDLLFGMFCIAHYCFLCPVDFIHFSFKNEQVCSRKPARFLAYHIIFQKNSSKFNDYINLRNNAVRSSTLASLGLPGAQASACADSARKGRSSSFSASSLEGIPTSSDSLRTASTAALR